MANFKAMLCVSLVMYLSYVVVGQMNPNIGVCYGLLGDNIPSPKQVVNLYKKYGIQKMRIYQPYPNVLEALRHSGIHLTLGTLNQDIPVLASSVAAAKSWFNTNVKPYINDVDIQYINVGNEVVPGQYSESIVPAMQNLQKVLKKNKLRTKVTTVVHSGVLGSSYPPSAGQFSEAARPYMRQIIQYLASRKNPILVNVYPYFPYASQPKDIGLEYAQFTTNKTVVQDGSLSYSNLLDAMLDTFYWAMEKEGVYNVKIIISESGWPHAGNGNFTTPELAATYNRNFIKHISNISTPKRPNAKLEGYLFDIIDEDQKAPGVEQNWGLFNSSMQPNYSLL
ncbi:hypothetical protein RND81_11G165300 [Saponaria officinalis]|uniref:Glucan endo-1,3-beta-D-glucosidase n=1 Tax=Saponaria officinalis TaxID=3572 RepID=A0AAW1HM15_SAPOF